MVSVSDDCVKRVELSLVLFGELEDATECSDNVCRSYHRLIERWCGKPNARARREDPTEALGQGL